MNTAMRRAHLLFTVFFVTNSWAVTNSSVMCPRLTLENGRVKLRSQNRVAKFRCRRNFLMIEGDRFATCSLGAWRGNIPKCVGSGCHTSLDIPHGRSLLLFGDALAQFECEPGYELTGSTALSCNGRRWNDTLPRCMAPAHTLYDCSFETPSVCTWNLEDSDEMRWQWSRGPPPVQGAGTRPSADHTLGNSTGHCLYVDGSANAVWESTARLYSPLLQPFVISPSCATLWVTMRGPTTGELNIYLKPESEELDIQAAEASLTGSQGDEWRLVYISLQDMDEAYQVVVEAVWGDGYMSDIAVDDFLATYGSRCIDLETTYIKQGMTQRRNATGGSVPDDDGPRPSPIPITTPGSFTFLTVPFAPDTTTLPQRTPAATASTPPTTRPTTTPPATTKSTTTQPNAVTPPPVATTTTTTRPRPTLNTKPTTTSVATTATTTTTSSTTSTTTRAAVTKPTTLTSATKTTSTTTQTPKVTTTRFGKITPVATTTTASKIPTKTTGTPPAAASTTNDLPVSNEVKLPQRNARFSAFLILLLVSLVTAFIVITSIFVYKKLSNYRQIHLSSDSDVKYLQQGDDESTGVGDSDSMIYHPRNSSSVETAETSRSSSVSSSLASTISGNSSSGRKPIRPPPPVPFGSASKCASPRYTSLSNSSTFWADSPELREVMLPTAEEDVPPGQGPLHPEDSGSSAPPPPLPPRSYGAGTSV